RRAAELDSIVTVSVEIPPSQHSQLIGKRGSNLRTLQTAHNVQINFPKSSTSSTVQISGLPDACAAASAALLALVRQESVVEVPLALHRRLVAARDHTRLWDDVAAKFAGVSVDSPRVDKPSRAYEAQLIALRSTPNELVDLSPHLIVDPESPVHLPTAEWVVRGSDKSAIAGAVSYIKAFLTSYCTTHAFATAIPVDRKHHRFIIGRGGSVIQAIREDTGAAIDVPKDADFVIILGSKDAIEAAKSKILDIVSSRT
ncbi:Vigilin, partial [Zancudomyces culisetae]